MTALDTAKLIASLEIFRSLPEYKVHEGEDFILMVADYPALVAKARQVLDTEYALNEFRHNAINAIEKYLENPADPVAQGLVNEVLVFGMFMEHILNARKTFKTELIQMLYSMPIRDGQDIGDLGKIPHTIH